VFSKHLLVRMESKNSASADGFLARPSFEQSLSVQKVGTMMSFAPCAIISRNASGNAKSQQTTIPTLPSGVSNTGCASRADDVRCNLSIGPHRFFFTYLPLISPLLSIKYATFNNLSPASFSSPFAIPVASTLASLCSSTMVPGTMQMSHSLARAR